MYIIYSSEWQSYCNCTEEDKGSNHSNSGHPGILHTDISKLQCVTSTLHIDISKLQDVPSTLHIDISKLQGVPSTLHIDISKLQGVPSMKH